MASNLKSEVAILSCDMNILGKTFFVVLIVLQVVVPFPFEEIEKWWIPPASAVLYSPDTKVPRTGEVALRKAIPANSAMKNIQDSLEDIFYLLRIPQRKPYGTMEGDVKKALKIATDEKDLILGTIPLDKKETGSKLYEFLIDGQVVLDGYSAPLTAGNFVKLVIDGKYDGVKLQSTEQAIISDNDRGDVGFSLPIEVMPAGGFEPLYRTTLSVQAGLGGLSFDEGQFSVFGYTISGREVLPQLKTGDIIKSIKLVDGLDHLVLPSSST